MDQIHRDCNSSKRNNWKAVPPGSKRSSLYSCNSIDIEVSLINFFLWTKWHWKWSACFGHVPVCHPSCWWYAISVCLGSMLSDLPIVLISGFHIAWAGSCFSFLSKHIYFTFSGSWHPGCAHHLGYFGHSEWGFLQSFPDLNSGCSVNITPVDWLGFL